MYHKKQGTVIINYHALLFYYYTPLRLLHNQFTILQQVFAYLVRFFIDTFVLHYFMCTLIILHYIIGFIPTVIIPVFCYIPLLRNGGFCRIYLRYH